MKKIALFLLVIVTPLALFAQGQRAPGRQRLQRLGLTDTQIGQVMEVQSRTREAVAQNAAQARVLQAQIEKAMVASTIDLQTVNALVDQFGQARAAVQKAMLAARVQLQQIMGPDTFRVYVRQARQQFARGPGYWQGPRFQLGPLGRWSRPTPRGGDAWL